MKVCNLIPVARMVGVSRVIEGVSILHALGNPSLDPDAEKAMRKALLLKALAALQAPGEEQAAG